MRSSRSLAFVLAALLAGVLAGVVFYARSLNVSSIEAAGVAARAALARGDFAAASTGFQKLLRELPGHPGLQKGLASSLVGLGRLDEAEAVFSAMLDEGFGGMVVGDSAFAKLAGRSSYEALRMRASAQAVPLAPATGAFDIPQQKFITESVAFDPDSGRFFVGSTYLRKIVVREPDGRLSDFVMTGDHGLLQVLGMKVDRARSRLVVLTATDDARLVDFKPADRGRSGVFNYDLRTGRLLQATWLAEPGIHLFNDLVLTADGTAFITDSDAGRVYRLSSDGRALAPLTPAGALLYPNGIDFDPSRNVVYVADLRGIFRMDPGTGRLQPVPQPRAVFAGGIDGLYLHGDDLIGVQNLEGADRVIALHLSKDHERIESSRTLESGDPRLSIATEGVLVGDELYFVANSHQDAADAHGVIAAPERTAPTSILALDLARMPGGG